MPESALNSQPNHINVLPAGDNTALRALCAELSAQITAFLQEDIQAESLKRVQEQTKISLGVIEDALKKYSLSEISISYNGGKDCLVLLILFLAALSTYPGPLPSLLSAVYIVPPHPFPEVDTFVAASSAQYYLSLSRHKNANMKDAFSDYLDEMPNVKAIFVGTRRTDPHGELLTFFDMTDHGWPEFMRCHPVIDWHYKEIWTFIRHLRIPYCELYDRGFTSLGGTTDTRPNPVLKRGKEASEEAATFRPAYELLDDDEERLGRDR